MVAQDENLILSSKLKMPQIKTPVLSRERLLKLLKENLHEKLVLICADAGYGKTNLLVSLVNSVKIPHVWYNLEPNDRSLKIFLKYIIFGLRKYVATFCEALLAEFSRTGHLVAKEASLKSFLIELQRLPPTDFWLILDDYQNVASSEEINDCMNFLLAHAPTNFHLVVSTRSKPSFSTSRIKSKGELYELLASDLSFTFEETVKLFHDIWKLDFSKEHISKFWLKTRGWITGLYLLMTLLKNRTTADLSDLPSAVHTDLYDYFTQELLLNQPKTIQNFLLKTSILNTLQPEICNELMGIKDSHKIINYLETAGLFTYRVDKEHNIFQYHPLFREFLSSCVTKTVSDIEIVRLYSKAASIFKRSGDYMLALDYFTKVKKWHAAVDLMVTIINDPKQFSNIFQLEDYLSKLPIDFSERDAKSQYTKAMLAYYQGRPRDALALMEKTEKGLRKKNKRRELLNILQIQANIHNRLGYGEKGLFFANQALRLHPQAKTRADILCFAKGPGLFLVGRVEEARKSLFEAFRICDKIGDLSRKAKVYGHLGGLSYEFGDLIKAREYYESAQKIFKELNDPVNEGIALINLGSIYNLIRDEERVLDIVDRALELSTKFNMPEVHAGALTNLAQFKVLRGDAEGYNLFDEALQIYKKMDRNFGIAKTLLTYSDAKRLNRDFSGAYSLMNTAVEHVRRHGFEILRPFCQITKAIIECELGYYSKAEEELNTALKKFKKIKNKYYIFLSHLYLGYLHYLSKRDVSSRRNFALALNMAKDNGYEIAFIIEKDISLPLLGHHFKTHYNDEYVKSVFEKIGKNAAEYLLPLIDAKDISLSKTVVELLARIGDSKTIAGMRKWSNNDSLRESVNFTMKCISSKRDSVFEIHFFGKMEVVINNTLIEYWKYKPAEHLFQLLVLNKNRRMHREEVMDKLWPDQSLDKASANFYNTLSRLRGVLEPERTKYSKFSVVHFERENCWFEMKEGDWFDVDEFLEHYRIGKTKEREDIKASLNAYHKAGKYYRGDLLSEEKYLDWVDEERRHLRTIYIEILFKIAQVSIQDNAYDQAIEQYKQVLKFDPCNEMAHCQLILCYLKISNRQAALSQYQICENSLKQQLGLTPSVETKRLLETIFSH